MRLVIFGYGNPSRGDDALGPALLSLLETTHAHQENIEIIEDFQLQIEHALDLIQCDLALFIDASVSCPSPLSFTQLLPQKVSSYTSHAMHPSDILYVYQQTQSHKPPPAFLLSIRGVTFELGQPLSSIAKNNLVTAFALLNQLCEKPNPVIWQQLSEELPS